MWELTDITLDELIEKAPLDDGPFASHLHYLREMIRTYPDLARGVRKLLDRISQKRRVSPKKHGVMRASLLVFRDCLRTPEYAAAVPA